MTLEPLYQAQRLNPAYQLRYSWTAWPADPHRNSRAMGEVLNDLLPLWEDDGLRVLEHTCAPEKVQFTFSTKPDVSPVLLAGRAKGRLQYAMRHADATFAGFTRKLSVRSVGENCTKDVEAYVAGQVDKERFLDPRFRDFMKRFTVTCPEVDLSVPSESARGRYWYNLHLVLAVVERYRVVDENRLETIRDCSFRIAQKKGHRIAALSVMPDHVHLALRGNPFNSPQEIALSFQNNLAYALGQMRLWSDNFYVGTFGEYDMGAIRRNTPLP